MTLTLGGNFETYNDPMGNPLIALERNGNISALGLSLPDGVQVNALLSASVTYSAADVTSHVQKTLVPALGANKFVFPLGVWALYTYAGVPFVTNGGSIQISLNPLTGEYIDILEDGFLDQSASQMASYGLFGAAQPLSGVTNQPLTVSFTADTTSGGTGATVKFVVYYTIISL